MGKTVINGQNYSGSSDVATNILYNNSRSKMRAKNVQNAVDELSSAVNGVIVSVRSNNWVAQSDTQKYTNTVYIEELIGVNTSVDVRLYDRNPTPEQITAFDELVESIDVEDGMVIFTASKMIQVSFTVAILGRINFTESNVMYVRDLSAEDVNYNNQVLGVEAKSLKEATEVLAQVAGVLVEKPVDNNILINSNFANPVNQRGESSYTGTGGVLYTIDRWYTFNSIVSVRDKFIKVTSNSKNLQIVQKIESTEYLRGKKVTASAKYRVNKFSGDGTSGKPVPKIIFQIDSVTDETVYFSEELNCDTEWHTTTVTADVSLDGLYMTINICGYTDDDIDIEWMKVEEGEFATPYVPRLYAEEMSLCKRFYDVRRLYDATVLHVGPNAVTLNLNIGQMRTTPTVDFTNARIDNNNTYLDGFEFTVPVYSYGSISIVANKSNHGLTTSDLVSGGGYIILDAEL